MDPTTNNQPAGAIKTQTGPTQEEVVVKIENVIKSIPAVRGKDAKPAATRLLQPAESPSVSDEVKLTGTSDKMRQLEGELSHVDVSDSAKIEAIRQAIADGNFSVDEEAVAEGMVQESIANIGRRSGLENE